MKCPVFEVSVFTGCAILQDWRELSPYPILDLTFSKQPGAFDMPKIARSLSIFSVRRKHVRTTWVLVCFFKISFKMGWRKRYEECTSYRFRQLTLWNESNQLLTWRDTARGVSNFQSRGILFLRSFFLKTFDLSPTTLFLLCVAWSKWEKENLNRRWILFRLTEKRRLSSLRLWRSSTFENFFLNFWERSPFDFNHVLCPEV